MGHTDMVTRILNMYEELRTGKQVHKASYCEEYGISERTFDRDIEKIRNYLSEFFCGKEVVYLSRENAYKLMDVQLSQGVPD